MPSKVYEKRLEILKRDLAKCKTEPQRQAVREAFRVEEAARREYLHGVESEIRGMRRNTMPSNVCGAAPDGMIEISPDRDLGESGFDLLTTVDVKDEHDFDPNPAETYLNDGWKGAGVSKKKYIRENLEDGFDELDQEDSGEPFADLEWTELKIQFESVGYSLDRLSGHENFADENIEYHRATQSLLYRWERRNSPLGRPSYEIPEVAEFRRDAALGPKPWQSVPYPELLFI